jgi:hypothetical protein
MMRRSLVVALGLALGAILSQATSVRAASSLPLTGEVATENGSNLITSTQITADSFQTTGPGTGSYAGIPGSTDFSAASGDIVLNLTNLTLSTFTNATYGSFVTTSVTIESQTATNLNVYILGTFGGATTSLNLSVVETSGTVSESMVLSTPPAGASIVPEPASIVLGMTSLVGCGLFFGVRHRSRKGSTA